MHSLGWVKMSNKSSSEHSREIKKISTTRALKMHFQPPKTKIKCVLSIKKKYSEGKLFTKSKSKWFSPPPPYDQPDRKIPLVFLTTSLVVACFILSYPPWPCPCPLPPSPSYYTTWRIQSIHSPAIIFFCPPTPSSPFLRSPSWNHHSHLDQDDLSPRWSLKTRSLFPPGESFPQWERCRRRLPRISLHQGTCSYNLPYHHHQNQHHYHIGNRHHHLSHYDLNQVIAGEHDTILKWPFRHTISFTLLDQVILFIDHHLHQHRCIIQNIRMGSERRR